MTRLGAFRSIAHLCPISIKLSSLQKDVIERTGCSPNFAQQLDEGIPSESFSSKRPTKPETTSSMDLKTFLSCQDWLTDIPVAEDSAEDGHDPSISSPPRKRRRRSSQARETRTPHAKCVLRGHLRFAAAWEQFGASPGVPGAPATAVPDSQASAQTSQASAVSAKAKTPKKKVEPPMILYFSPPGRADADEELVDSLAQSLPPRPPRFADTRRNGRIVIPLEASSKKDLRADRDLSRVGRHRQLNWTWNAHNEFLLPMLPPQFTYSLYQHPTHPLLFLSLDFPEPVIYAVDPKRIRLLSLPPADPNPGPIPPHATFVFDTGCTLLFEAEVKEDGKGREARGQRAKLAATLRKWVSSLLAC